MLFTCLLEVHDQHIMCNVFTMYIIIYNYCVLAHLLAVLVLMPAALANRQMMFVTGRQEQSILPYNYWYANVFRLHLLEKKNALDITHPGDRNSYLMQN